MKLEFVTKAMFFQYIHLRNSDMSANIFFLICQNTVLNASLWNSFLIKEATHKDKN